MRICSNFRATILLLLVVFTCVCISTGKQQPALSFLKQKPTAKLHSDVSQIDVSSFTDHSATRLVAQSTSSSLDKLRGPACVLGGALAHLTLGTLYCWGNFMSYAPSSLQFFDGKEHPGVPFDSMYVLPFTLITQAIAMPFGPSLAKVFGPSKTMLFGCWLAALAVYLASFQTRLLPFIALYSLLFGTGVGLAYTAPMAAGWKWLPEAKGLVSGGVLAGFGAGGFIFSMIGSKLVNPQGFNPVNGKFPAEVYSAFPNMLRKLAMLYAIVSFVGSLLVSEPQPALPASPASSQKTAVTGLAAFEALKTRQFWLLWVMIISAATAGLNTASVYKAFANSAPVLAGDQFQALVGGIGALFNGFGRLFWGSVSDRFGFKNSFVALALLQTALLLTYQLSTASKAAFLANTCGLFFCLAGNLALMPPATLRLFGTKAGTVIYGVLYSAFAIASVVGGMLTKSLATRFGYEMVFRVMAVMTMLATALVSRIKPISSFDKSQI